MNNDKLIRRMKRKEVLAFVITALVIFAVLAVGVYLAVTLLPASVSTPITLSVMLVYDFVVAAQAIEKFKY